MVEVKLRKIIIDEKDPKQLVVLKEKGGSRILPIAIGINEASAIKLELSGFVPPRPLTHDLVCGIIKKLGAEVAKIVIDDLINGVFQAKIYLIDSQNKALVIDARPSDSIAVAVRTKSLIFAEEKVFSRA